MPRDGTIEVDGTLIGDLQSIETISGELQTTQDLSGTLSMPAARIVNRDYEKLENKPIHQDTTEAWNSQPNLIAKAGHLYFYTDYQQVGGVNIAGLKLGDGTSYLIDLPFEDAQFQEHISDTIIHITQEEREFWNNKNRAVITGENLVLTKL